VVESHAQAHLEAGTLQALLQDHAAPFPGFFLYYPSRRLMPAALKLFAAFLGAQGSRRSNRLLSDAEQPMSNLEDYVLEPGQ